jgi:hypothetical protein
MDMLGTILTILAVWFVASIPVGLLVGRMFAQRNPSASLEATSQVIIEDAPVAVAQLAS